MRCSTRNTCQRQKILEYLESVKTHPTAETVYEAVKQDLPAISLATVYRNLNLLAERSKILKFEVNKEFRFDADMSCHQHCVCRKCGKITDEFQKKTSNFAMKNLKAVGFKPDCVKIIFYGHCTKCRG